MAESRARAPLHRRPAPATYEDGRSCCLSTLVTAPHLGLPKALARDTGVPVGVNFVQLVAGIVVVVVAGRRARAPVMAATKKGTTSQQRNCYQPATPSKELISLRYASGATKNRM